MGNNLISLNRFKHRDRSKYSHIDQKTNEQSWLQDSRVEEWDSLWKDVTHENVYYRSEYGKLHIYRNEITLEEVQRYRTVLNDKHDFEKWKQLVHWRNNCQHLVKIEHFMLKNQGEMCVSQYEVNVFVERIPLRLSDLTDIPYPENLYFLLCVIKGFKYIFQSPYPISNFKITQSLICVNKQGQVKVWLNPNLSEFQSVNQKQDSHITQQQILKSLIEKIEQNTDQRDYPYTFQQYLNDRKILINGNFNIIIQQLYCFAKDMKVVIPKYAFSVRDILTRDLFMNTKLQSQNSFSNQVHFTNENPQMKRDPSLSVINSFEYHPERKEGQQYGKFVNREEELFPRQKLHGLTPVKKTDDPPSLPFESHLPIFSKSQKQQQATPMFSQINIRSNEGIYRHDPIPPFTDRNFNNGNPNNNYQVRINRIGNNIIQFPNTSTHFPQNFTQQGVQQPQQRQFHSLDRANPRQENSNAPPGYRMVERKIIHAPPNFFPPNQYQQPTPNFQPYQPYVVSNQQKKQNFSYQSPLSPALNNIERVDSKPVPFSSMGVANAPRTQSIERPVPVDFGFTRRPQQISNPMKIERISRQSSQRAFSNSQPSNENLKKTNSFKNSLIKFQQEEKETERAVSNLKYFTKKDSEETLDPEIAGDLLKYLNQQPG